MSRKTGIVVIITGLLIALGAGVWFNQQWQTSTGFSGTVENVRIGFTFESLEASTVIAEDQGYFIEEGLNVTIKEYPTGKIALHKGLFGGEIDIAPVAEVPIVFNLFKRQDFSILATIGSADDQMKIVARRDRGIQKPEDLRGKSIATQKGSAAHIFLHLFLVNQGLTEKNVDLSFNKATNLAEALGKGEIDAFSMKEPFIGKAKDLLRDNAIIFNPRRIYFKTFNLVAFNHFIEKKPEVIKRILSALIKSEKFYQLHPEQAMEILLKYPGIAKSEIPNQWQTIELNVSLEQWFLLELEDEARWIINNKLTDKTEIPDFLNYIYIDGLAETKPEGVTIIG